MPTYPLEMPTTGVHDSEFRIVRMDAVNRRRNGVLSVTEIAPPYWLAEITTTNLFRRTERFSLWRRFLDACRGAMKVVLLYDPDLPYPAAYDNFDGMTKAIGGAFVGTGDVDTVSNPNTYVVSGLPANFIFTAGDYIGFVKSSRYWLCRIVDDVVANGSGIASVNVEPEVPAFFDATATIQLYRPKGEFLVDSESISMPRSVEDGKPMSFTATSRAM